MWYNSANDNACAVDFFEERKMSEKTKIYIVRHGESLGNAQNLILGHTDKDLTPLGYRQAQATADFLATEKIDVVYSSDLMRAMHTAQPHAQIRGYEVIARRGLRELHTGEWEDMHVSECIEKYGDMFLKDWRAGFGTFVMPGGEGVMEAGRRFYSALEEIAVAEQGRVVLVASHAGVIRAFWSIISGVAPEDVAERIPFPSNASYSIVEYESGVFTPVAFSCDEHLADVGITKIKT